MNPVNPRELLVATTPHNDFTFRQSRQLGRTDSYYRGKKSKRRSSRTNRRIEQMKDGVPGVAIGRNQRQRQEDFDYPTGNVSDLGPIHKQNKAQLVKNLKEHPNA